MPTKGAKKGTSASRKARHAQYRAMKLREIHKLKRIFQSSSLSDTKAYASKHELNTLLAKLVSRKRTKKPRAT